MPVVRERRAFSMIESTLAVLVVGGALVAGINAATAAASAHGAASTRRQADALARLLMEEVLRQPVGVPNDGPPGSGQRINNFNHIMDYDGWRETPPLLPDGTPAASAGWAWGVQVAPRPAEDVAGQLTDLGLLTVTVTVEPPDGTATTLTALRGRNDQLRPPSTATHALLVQAQLRLTLPGGATLTAGAAPDAHKPPAAPARTESTR